MAKNKWEKAGPDLEALTVFRALREIFSWMSRPRYSRQRIKMYGKIGSPCLIPREGLKDSSLPPLKRMKTVGDEIQSIIRDIRFGGKLKWISTS